MTDETANADYDLLHAAGVGVCFSSYPTGCEEFHGRPHLLVQTSGYAPPDLDRLLPLLHRVRTSVSLEFLGPVADDHLRHLAGLANLLSLKIGAGVVTDTGLRHLAGLTSLRVLDLARQAVSDAGVGQLAGLANLRELTLRGTQVGDDRLASLAGLTALTKLDLDGCAVTDRGAAALCRLAGLTSLDLSGTRVGDDGLAAIGRLASLESLSLDGLPVTDQGMGSLGTLPALRSLSLHGTRVGGDGAPWLAGLTQLGWLTLSETAVTDAALVHLAGHAGLITLRLDGTAVTGAGLIHLPTGLAHLSLTGVRLRADDLSALGRLDSLHSFVVDAEAVAGPAADVLEQMSFGRRPAWGEGVAAFERLRACPLCRLPVRDDEPVFCTRPYTPPDPDLFAFARVPLHWGCYTAWEHRLRFARQYFEEQGRWAEGNSFWGIARRDDAVLVSVNPAQYVAEVDVILAATGSSLRVPLGGWEDWVAGGWFDSCAHEAERDALGEVIPALRADLPTAAALLTAAGVAAEVGAPPPGVEPGGAVERISYEFACQKLAARAAEQGVACPHCGHFGTDFVYERVEVVSTDGPQSALVCPACEERFGPNEV